MKKLIIHLHFTDSKVTVECYSVKEARRYLELFQSSSKSLKVVSNDSAVVTDIYKLINI